MRVRARLPLREHVVMSPEGAASLVGQEFTLTGYGRRVVLDAGVDEHGDAWYEFDAPAALVASPPGYHSMVSLSEG